MINKINRGKPPNRNGKEIHNMQQAEVKTSFRKSRKDRSP